MSPMQWSSHNNIMPADPDKSPGERDDEIGPGWSWMAIHPPHLESNFQYRWSLFDTAGQAIGDLARCLEDGNPGRVKRIRSARMLRGLRAPGPLVLSDPSENRYVFFSVYEVARNVHVTDAADWAFASWLSAGPRRRFELTSVRKPTIWRLY